MTPLGKMLAVFVFLVSLLWAGLTVNTFVSRTNWKAEADKYQKQAKDAADAAEALRREVLAERAAVKIEVEALKRDRDATVVALDSVRNDYKLLQTQIDDKLTEALKQNPKLNEENSRLAVLQTEVTNLTGQLGKAQDEVVVLNKTAAGAKIAQEQAQRDAAAEKQRAGNLENQLRNTDDKLKEALARAKQGVGEGVAVRPTAPDGFRGTVKRTIGEFVEITPGGNTGLRSGTKLTVRRVDLKNPLNSRFVGYLTVREEIDPDKAACEFTPPQNKDIRKLSAADFPLPGDEVHPESK